MIFSTNPPQRTHGTKRTYRHRALIVLTLFLASCSAIDNIRATPTLFIPTETPLPTATYAWFPPSVTPSAQAFVTQLPTPEMRPGLGSTILTDNFTRKSLWDTATSDQGSAQINDGQINVAAQSKVYMFSLRHDLVLNDFYAEVTARPNLCRGDDTYGMLVRASAVSYYRFALTCNGLAGAERASVRTRQVLQAPIPSGDVPPGAPGEVRIGVWAVGSEMRLFLNGRYQFTVSDTNYASGTIGVFVNSAGENPALVSFSDLTVQEVSYTAPTSTPKP